METMSVAQVGELLASQFPDAGVDLAALVEREDITGDVLLSTNRLGWHAMGCSMGTSVRIEQYIDTLKPKAGFQIEKEKRSFVSGAAISLASHFYTPWQNLPNLVSDIKEGRWLLLAAPWQSGKTSLLTGLAQQLRQEGYLVVLTTLTPLMVMLANNEKKDELAAARDFFEHLAGTVELDSRSVLRKMLPVSDMFRTAVAGVSKVVWMIDEGHFLNSMFHTTGYAVQQLLTELRTCKQHAPPRDPEGTYCLSSFVLCGLPRLSGLIGSCAVTRRQQIQDYVASSPSRQEKYDPLRPTLKLLPSPLSKEAGEDNWALTLEGIAQMLSDYAADHRVTFTENTDFDLSRDAVAEHERVLAKIAEDIYESTVGHKGLVGCCCEVVQRRSVSSYQRWQQLVRTGALKDYVFRSRVYDQLVVNSAAYSSKLKQIIIECIQSEDGLDVMDMDDVLEALDEGVLVQVGETGKVRLSSPLLISSLLESSAFSSIEHMPEPTSSLLVAFEAAISFMRPDIFLREKVLNATGQPSEYIMQSQLLLGLKFVFDKRIYTGHQYKVLVETRQKKKHGMDRLRMDFSLEDGGSPEQGIKAESGGNAKSIRRHITNTDKNRVLHSCEMHYICFRVRHPDYSDDGALGVIKEYAIKFPKVLCWHAEYFTTDNIWVISRFDVVLKKWNVGELPTAPEFPSFLLAQTPHARKRKAL